MDDVSVPATPTAKGRIASAEGVAGKHFRALQDDVAMTVVDWHVVHAWRPGDPDFVGELTIVNEQGRELLSASWADPTDEAADQSLVALGWGRTGPWVPDWLGRRSAPVNPEPAIPEQRTA